MRGIPAGLLLVLILGYSVAYILNRSGLDLGGGKNQASQHPTEIEINQTAPNPVINLEMNNLEHSVLAEVNQQRRNHGLRDLLWHEDLARVARRHSSNMGTRRFFSHVDPVDGDLKSRMEKAHLVNWRRCGENILMESYRADPVRSAVEGWMNSPGHRQNILNPAFTHTGIGVAVGSDNLLYFTQAFLLPS